jgi:hypothetical protein
VEEDAETIEGEDLNEGDTQTWGGSVMVFRETRIGRWVGVGPYAEVMYTDTKSSSESRRTSYGDALREDLFRTEYSAHTWKLVVGVRPTFTFKNRFALESRLGIALTFIDSARSRTSAERTQVPEEEPRVHNAFEHTHGDEWGLEAFGEELGPGATLTFIAYF